MTMHEESNGHDADLGDAYGAANLIRLGSADDDVLEVLNCLADDEKGLPYAFSKGF